MKIYRDSDADLARPRGRTVAVITGRARRKGSRQEAERHPSETVGRRLRALMAWLGSDPLPDKSGAG